MEGFLQDVRDAGRSLCGSPLTTLVAVGGLTLGIGVNMALFSLADAVALRPLALPEAHELVVVAERHAARGWERHPVAPAKLADWRREARSFAALAASRTLEMHLAGPGGAERVPVAQVEPGLPGLLGIEPLLGRSFRPEDGRQGSDAVLLLGHRAWRQRFGGREDVLGTAVTLEGRPHVVIGVLPPDVPYPVGAEGWTPLVVSNPDSRVAHGLNVVGRLRADVDLEAARREMEEVAARLAARHPDTDAGWSIDVTPLHRVLAGDLRPVLTTLLAAAVAVLLLGCLNVAAVGLARAEARRPALAVRAALGASRWRLGRLLLAEGVLLGVTGGLAAVLLGTWAVDALASGAVLDLPAHASVRLDGRVLGFTILVASVTSLVAGLLPAWRATLADPASFLRGGAGRSTGQRSVTRRALVVGEVALALALTAGAGLLVQSMIRLGRVDPGFEPSGVVTGEVRPPRHLYPAAGDRASVYDRILERLAGVPGATAVGAVSRLPLLGGAEPFRVWVEGRTPGSFEETPRAEMRAVGGEYFRTLGIPLVAGRRLSPSDDATAPPVVLVNETMARTLWPGADAVGRRISLDGPEGPWRTVVGVVGDVRHFGLDREARAELYAPYRQEPWPSLSLVTRFSGDPTGRTGAVRGAVRGVDPALPLTGLSSLAVALEAELAGPRLHAGLSAGFAGIGLLLALTGVYGVVAHGVERRTREMGIRVALGASPGAVVRLLAWQGGRLALLGVVAGLPLALAGGSWLSDLLYGVDPGDPLTPAACAALLVAAALAASWLPARRLLALDPAETLRRD